MADICARFQAKGIKKVDRIPFTLGNELGQGAFGTVYEGIYDNNEVAVKEIRLGAIGEKMIDQTIEETLALKNLQASCGEFIVKVYDMLIDDKCTTLYIVMEKLAADLSLLPINTDVFVPQELNRAWDHCFAGLQCIHNQKIYHRDMKPENILVSENGEFKLTDFGLSCMASKCYGFVGSPLYIDPSLIFVGYTKCQADMANCLQDDALMRATDFWGLGMSFLNLLLEFPLRQHQLTPLNAAYWDLVYRTNKFITYEDKYDGPDPEEFVIDPPQVSETMFYASTEENPTTGEREIMDGGVLFSNQGKTGAFDLFDEIFSAKIGIKVADFYHDRFKGHDNTLLQELMSKIEKTLIYDYNKRLLGLFYKGLPPQKSKEEDKENNSSKINY